MLLPKDLGYICQMVWITPESNSSISIGLLSCKSQSTLPMDENTKMVGFTRVRLFHVDEGCSESWNICRMKAIW